MRSLIRHRNCFSNNHFRVVEVFRIQNIVVPTTTDLLLYDFISLTNYVLNHKCIFHSVDTALLVKGPH